MVELRKRKAPPPQAAVQPSKKKATTNGKATAAKKEVKSKGDVEAPTVSGTVDKAEDYETKTSSGAKKGPPAVGDVIDLNDFGGEVETQEGTKVTLKQLVGDTKAGVVLFTYPKANTPGCTTQACAFRDGHTTLTSTGLAIYGLSGDGPKSNTTFKTKHALPYNLLCNPSYSLIGAIGMQQPGAKKTKRGVFAVDKAGRVLLAETGGPLPTVDAVKKLVDKMDA